MTVLTLAGKPINWAKPPKPTDMVMWNQRSMYGHIVKGSLRHIAHLDRLNNLAIKKFGRGIVIIQTAFNTGVKASAGTHDLDMCEDAYIPGVSYEEFRSFLRANGAGGYYRYPPLFTPHCHWFTLPQRVDHNVSEGYALRGYKVGELIDGGYSRYGRKVTSSQIEDYYNHDNALVGHAHDPSWFPADIDATVFSLSRYIKARRPSVASPNTTLVDVASAAKAYVRVATNNLMALPKNKHVMSTLLSAPTASVLMVQEANLFHSEIQHVPGYDTALVPKGETFSTFVLYRPEIWDHVSTHFRVAYHGVEGISYTRHVAVTILRHKALGTEMGFISYHAVTAGGDRRRKSMRRSGDAAVRKEVRALRKRGIPVFVGTDENRTGNIFVSRASRAKHRIDSIYQWNGRGLGIRLTGTHHINTTSDHDTLVAEYTATKK